MENIKNFQCKHCNKKFSSERIFMNHYCSEMKRNEILKTVDGQASYILYSYWLKKQNRKEPSIETFSQSTYFRSFYNFVKFIKDVTLYKPEEYIEIMIEKKISPRLWPRNECYSLYLQWQDNKLNPMQQVDVSVNTVLKISDNKNIHPSKFFELIDIKEIILLIQERKLFPWFLLCSKKFKEKLSTISDHDNKQLMKLIGINYWAEKLSSNENIVKNIKIITKELEI